MRHLAGDSGEEIVEWSAIDQNLQDLQVRRSHRANDISAPGAIKDRGIDASKARAASALTALAKQKLPLLTSPRG